MENKEFLEQWKNYSEFSLQLEEIRFLLLRAIRNNLQDETIQKIADWKGIRTTDYYDEEGYCDLCAKIYNKFYGKDLFCSSSMHNIYRFISDAVIFTAEQNKKLILQIKKDKIKSLEEEISKLKEEL